MTSQQASTIEVPHIPSQAVQLCIKLLQSRKRKIEEPEAVIEAVIENVKKPKQKVVVSNGFRTCVTHENSRLEIKKVERNCFSMRFIHKGELTSCLKIQIDDGMDSTMSILFGNFNAMEEDGSFRRLISMVKEYLFRNDIRSLGLSISREDYDESMVKKCANSFEMITCPEEWKGRKHVKKCRELLKEEAIGNYPFYFRDYNRINAYSVRDVLLVNL